MGGIRVNLMMILIILEPRVYIMLFKYFIMARQIDTDTSKNFPKFENIRQEKNINKQKSMKLQKQTTYKFLKRLNKQLSNKFAQMKMQFDRNPPANHQIKKRFHDWKPKYDQIVLSTLKEVQDIDQKSFDFKEFIIKITQEFGNDQEFLELLKNVNNSIQNLKDFIRVNLIKDPSIYEIKE